MARLLMVGATAVGVRAILARQGVELELPDPVEVLVAGRYLVTVVSLLMLVLLIKRLGTGLVLAVVAAIVLAGAAILL